MAVYLVQVLLAQFTLLNYAEFYRLLALDYEQVWQSGYVWQLLTYSVLHEVAVIPGTNKPLLDLLVCCFVIWAIFRASKLPRSRQEPTLFIILAFAAIFLVGQLGFGAPFHLGGNLLFLYFFGPMFERHWGPKRFIIFCALSATGGALLSSLLSLVLDASWVGNGAIGASGIMMGLLMAFTVYYKDETVMAGFVLPMRARHLLVLVIVFDVIAVLTPGSQVAFFVHMGGLLTGWLLTTGNWRPSRWASKLRLSQKKKPHRKPSHLRIVRNEDDDDPPYLH